MVVPSIPQPDAEAQRAARRPPRGLRADVRPARPSPVAAGPTAAFPTTGAAAFRGQRRAAAFPARYIYPALLSLPRDARPDPSPHPIYPAVMLRQNPDEHFAHRAFAQYAAAMVVLQVAASTS